MAEVWVKVCGLRTRSEVEAAVSAGADAIGFVLAPESSRMVTPEEVGLLAADVPITTVAVTVHLPGDDVAALIEATGVDWLQPHGRHQDAAVAAAEALGVGVLVPVPVDRPVSPATAAGGRLPHFDTPSPAHGGSGRAFDWSLIRPDGSPFVLAGGLGPDSVAEAVRRVRPWGVDASTGLEMAPGRKDPAKIAAYVSHARTA